MSQISRPATAAEIIEIVGSLDDSGLMRIMDTEATPAEVLEAFTWATADDQIGTELEHRPRGAVARDMKSSSAKNPSPVSADNPYVERPMNAAESIAKRDITVRPDATSAKSLGVYSTTKSTRFR
jgi:hypothetical protein